MCGEGTATSPVLDQTLLASLAHVLLVGTQRLPLPVGRHRAVRWVPGREEGTPQ